MNGTRYSEIFKFSLCGTFFFRSLCDTGDEVLIWHFILVLVVCFLFFSEVIMNYTLIFVIPTCIPLKRALMESVTASAVMRGELFVPNYVKNQLYMYAVTSPVILIFLLSTNINCILCSEVININVIYHLEISKNE